MPVNFEWDNNYNVGIEEIDSQHKRFLSIIQQIYNFKHADENSSHLKKLIAELEKYLVFHTKSEEMLMVLYDYPQQQKQKEEHGKIIAKVQGQLENLPEKRQELNELLIYLMKWFVNHTTCLDKDLGEHIQRQRLE